MASQTILFFKIHVLPFSKKYLTVKMILRQQKISLPRKVCVFVLLKYSYVSVYEI